jgi:hypothetical protein
MIARGCLLLALLLAVWGLGLSAAPVEAQSARGLFEVDIVNVTRINLAVKELDLYIPYAKVSANRSFEVAIWYVSHERGFFPSMSFGKPVSNSTSWNEWDFPPEWPLKSLVLETMPPDVPNTFPFESYQTEIIFGFNVTGISISEVPVTTVLPLDLAEQGRWNVKARVENTTQHCQKLAGQEDYIKKNGVVSFFSLVVELWHTCAYSSKMIVPTWGPIAFVFMMSYLQFCPLRRRIGRSDHISFFVAVAIFLLGSTIVTREFTPPELTLAELFGLVMTFVYTIVLVIIIYRRNYDA